MSDDSGLGSNGRTESVPQRMSAKCLFLFEMSVPKNECQQPGIYSLILLHSKLLPAKVRLKVEKIKKAMLIFLGDTELPVFCHVCPCLI